MFKKFLRLPFPFVSIKKNFLGFCFHYVSVNCSMLPCKPLGYTRTNILCVHGPNQMCICKRTVKQLLRLPLASLQVHCGNPFYFFLFYFLLLYFLFLFLLLYFIFYFFTCVPSFRSIYTCKTQYQYKYDIISSH